MAMSSMIAGIIRKGTLNWARYRVVRERLQHERDGAIELVCHPVEGDAPEETPDALVARLKREAAGLSRVPLILGIESENLLLRVMRLPLIEDPLERAAMVRLQVDKISPFSSDNSVVSHEILALRDDDTAIILAAAVQTDVANTMADMLAPAGLAPVRLDAEIMGWFRVLRQSGKIPESGRHMLMVVSNDVPHLVVMQDGCPCLFRVAANLGDLPEDERAAELAEELTQTLMSMELEHGTLKTTIHVWHDGHLPEGWMEPLREQLHCDVTAKPLSDLPPLLEGLAHRAIDPDCLDLTPPSWHDAEDEQIFRRNLLRWAFGLVAVWLLGIGALMGAVAFEQHGLRRLQEEKARWVPRAMQVRQMRRRVNTIRRYMDTSYSALECLREISSLLPGGVELTSFNYRKGEYVRLTGEAPQVNAIYDFKNRIDRADMFGESTLVGPRRDPRKRVETFEINIQLPGGSEL